MLDTIKVGIPISESQHEKLLYSCANDKPQWVLFHPQSGEIQFLRHKGLLEKDGESYHREIRWDIPETYRKDETYLAVELSLPKLWYGHNIRLLYSWIDALKELKKQLEKNLRCRFPSVLEWKTFRVDFCYAWKCPSQQTAQNILESLKRLRFPRKTPTTYRESIDFRGNTYSLKVYLKLPEFLEHDYKALKKNNANLEWIKHLEMMANGVLRFEATCRYKYLVRQKIQKVADLLKPDHDWKIGYFEDQNLDKHFWDIVVAICQYNRINAPKAIDEFADFLVEDEFGMSCISVPEIDVKTKDGNLVKFSGGTLFYERRDKTVAILNSFLKKYIGENVGMDDVAQVEEKLKEKYDSLKLTTLLGFWLYVQKCGIDAAKQLYPKATFYRMKSDLKQAGISLIEKMVVADDLNQEFIDSFKLKIPSNYVVNSVDDFRESGNLLNNSDSEMLPQPSDKKPVSDKLKKKIEKLKEIKDADKG